jgi:class 3 adenylate cyclase/tetratricopeptide (TPR) repeat protein
MAVCPVCGEDNPARARFCLACGTALEGEPERQREERKVISVLFCDLVGFTARSDNADPEDVRATLRPYHARLRKDIERFGGTVEKFIGDAVMAVFGAPVAHEDDAERAVRSALRIIESIAELNEEQPGQDLSVRIGVNTGEAVVALGARPEQGEGIVTGDVVNTAARLQTVAPVGGIVVGEATRRATKDLIDYEPMEPVTVKGKADPLPIWRALSARSRFGVDVEQATRTPFVGRVSEFAMLTQTFTRAVEEPSVQLVTVTGEPGVGKTRLLWELRRHLDDRPDLVYWRQGRCLPYGEGVTYWALGEMVKAQAGILESDGPEQVLEKLQTALTVVTQDEAERDWLRSRLTPLVGLAGPGEQQVSDRDEAFTAWRRFIESIAARDPLVLVFEDLHWADGPLIEFVEHLVEWSSGVPLLVVCSARPELYERHPGWGGGKRNSTTISLSPLSEPDTARLLSALLEQAVLPVEVQTELLDRAGGNPLYAEEFVRMLLDRGILERHGAALRMSEDAEDMTLPESVQALIGARLDTLTQERKALLQNASVVGKVFWSGAVASMGGLGEQDVRQPLHELSRKELVRTTRASSVKDQVEYSFWHALVRDVAYGQIPRAERAEKHLAVAAWIESTVGERMTDQAEFLAYHYERALELRAAAGREPGHELARKAATALQMAGERAQQLDMTNALSFFRRAEAVLPPDDPAYLSLHVKAVTAAFELGQAGAEEFTSAFEAALEQLRAEGETVKTADMLREFGGMLKLMGSTERSELVADEAIELLEPLGPSRALAAAYAQRAGLHMMVGQWPEWKRRTEAALEIADTLALPEIRMRALQFRGIYRVIEGDLQGRGDLEEALRVGIELGMGRETASAYINLADWTSELDGPLAGLALYKEGMVFASRRGLTVNGMWMRAESTWRLFDLGRWDEVIAAADEIRGWSGSEGGSQQLAMAGTQEARVRMYRGDLKRADELMDELLPLAREIRDVQTYRPALTTAAHIAAWTGHPDRTAALLDELEADFAGGGFDRTYGMLEGTLAARAVADVARAERIATMEVGFAPGFPVAHGGLFASEAEAAETAGRYQVALARFERALAVWEGLGDVFHRALALLGSARCLAALGRAADASQPASEAREIFATLGARSLAREADELVPGVSSLSS